MSLMSAGIPLSPLPSSTTTTIRSRNSYFRSSLRSPNLICSPRWEAVRRLANSFLPTCIKSEHTVICYMADLFCAMQWHSRRTVIQKKRAETESREEKRRFQRNTVCPLAPPFSLFFLVFYTSKMKRPSQPYNFEPFR